MEQISGFHLLLTHFVVYAALHFPYSGPTLLLLHLRVIVEDLIPQPRQVVNTHLVFLAFRKHRGYVSQK